jgi:hypothetical protein
VTSSFITALSQHTRHPFSSPSRPDVRPWRAAPAARRGAVLPSPRTCQDAAGARPMGGSRDRGGPEGLSKSAACPAILHPAPIAHSQRSHASPPSPPKQDM